MKKGFTLAEVLITLGVIGVIAALTMPNLLQNHQKRVFVSQLQRTYNMISNAATQLMSDENTTALDNTYLVEDNGPSKFLNTYFKVSKDCGRENRSECLGDTYYSLDRTDSVGVESTAVGAYDMYCVTVNTGATICMDSMYTLGGEEGDDPDLYKGWHKWSDIVIDVNGKQGPNTNGRDFFLFDLFSDGKMGNGYKPPKSMISGVECNAEKGRASYGDFCLQTIMSKGWVMDY